jgi:hypothetical protein
MRKLTVSIDIKTSGPAVARSRTIRAALTFFYFGCKELNASLYRTSDEFTSEGRNCSKGQSSSEPQDGACEYSEGLHVGIVGSEAGNDIVIMMW